MVNEATVNLLLSMVGRNNNSKDKTLSHCKMIIDNLMSIYRSMFKDVIVKMTYPQSSEMFRYNMREIQGLKINFIFSFAFYCIFVSIWEFSECVSQVLKVIQSSNLYAMLVFLLRIELNAYPVYKWLANDQRSYLNW
jgi:hypothetical protein